MLACAQPSAKKSEAAGLRASPTRVHHESPPASQQAGLLLAGRGPAPSWRRRPCGVVSGKRTDPVAAVKTSAALRAREGGELQVVSVTFLSAVKCACLDPQSEMRFHTIGRPQFSISPKMRAERA